MFTEIVKKLLFSPFSQKTAEKNEINAPSTAAKLHRPRGRRLCMEPLESRELLSVSPSNSVYSAPDPLLNAFGESVSMAAAVASTDFLIQYGATNPDLGAINGPAQSSAMNYTNQPITVKVMVLMYNPTVPSEGNKHLWEVMHWNNPNVLIQQMKSDIEASSNGMIKIELTEVYDLNEIPAQADGFRYTPDQYVQNRRSNTGWRNGNIDYYGIAEEFDVAAKVNRDEISEVWIVGDHYFNFWEAAMMGPGSFFINGGTYPNIAADRPFAVMGASYERNVDMALHNIMHRMENHMSRAYGGWNVAGTPTNWDRFTANAANTAQTGITPGVGNCHFPANGISDYDYANQTLVASTAEDWMNYPNLTGVTTMVNGNTWNNATGWHQWWLAHLPKADGVNPDGRQNNWWKYLYDFNNYQPQTGAPKSFEALCTSTDVVYLGGNTYEFYVAYTSPQFVNYSTIDSSDIIVEGPNGYRQTATLVKTSQTADNPIIVATYSITAPGGTWDTADYGDFSVIIVDQEVFDHAGIAIQAGTIGAFSCRTREATELPDSDTLFLLRGNGTLIAEGGQQPTSSSGSGVTFTDGLIDKGVHLTSSGFVQYPAQNNVNSLEGTIEFWYKPDGNRPANGTTWLLLQIGNRFNDAIRIEVDGGNNFRCIQWGDNTSTPAKETSVERGVSVSAANWQANEWYHLAVTWNGNTGELSLYLNGNKVSSIANNIKIENFASDAKIILGSTGTDSANGTIDELRISSVSRSAGEIAADYRKGLTLNIPLVLTLEEFNQIRTNNPDLGLSANMDDYNIIVIMAEELSVANLKSAITEAGTTTKPDLIVCRTTATQNTITYTSATDAISININATTYGSVAIVGFGTNPLTIDAAQKARGLNIASSTVAIANLIVTGGNASSGGGIYSYGTGSNLTVTNCTITENTASGDGGGLYSTGTGSTLTVTNCTIAENTASSGGGGIYISGTSTTITNCTIAENTATNYYGGGIYITGSPTVTLNNTIVSLNSANGFGGGIMHWGGSLTLNHSIIGTNSPNFYSSTTYTNNKSLIDVDPRLGERTLAANGQSYYPLLPYSRAINAGNNSYVTANAKDIAGANRIVNTTVDIGSYEFTGTPIDPNSIPESFTATQIGTTEVFLQWTAVTNATSYKLFRSTTKNGTYTEIASQTTTIYRDANISVGGTYYYKVQILGVAGTPTVEPISLTVIERNVPQHSSLPGSNYTIYLDFDGHVTSGTGWNTRYTNGQDIATGAFTRDDDPAFSSTEIAEMSLIWAYVAAAFAPFNVNVTTIAPAVIGVNAIRVVYERYSDTWYGSAGGVAYLNSFTWNSDTPAFVFTADSGNSPFGNAKTTVHEIGHTLGLSHQGDIYGSTETTIEYYAGHNNWAAIMGSSYSNTVQQWSYGTANGGSYYGAKTNQDDLAMINKVLAYRTDDDANGRSLNPGTINTTGIIEKNTDVDTFMITVMATSTLNLTIAAGVETYNSINSPFRAGSLYFKATIMSGSNVISTYDAIYDRTRGVDNLTVSFDNIVLEPGTYSLVIEGIGYGSWPNSLAARATGGFDDYGSIGVYSITGSIYTSEVNSLAADKTLIEAGTYAIPLAHQTDQATKTAWVQAAVNALIRYGSVAVVTWNVATSKYDVSLTNGSASGSATITVTEMLVEAVAPIIITQPDSATISVGTTHSISVEATVTDGGTLTYQWYSNTSATNTSGTMIAGATEASYVVPTTTTGAFYYYVVVTNTVTGNGGTGSASTTSDAATITVTVQVNVQTPFIITQPVSATIAFGTMHSVSVTATVTDGGTLSYQWYSSTTNTNIGGTAISGATGVSYVIPSSTAGTFYYYVVVTNTITDNGDGGTKRASITSSVATITVKGRVNADTPVITTQPITTSLAFVATHYVSVDVEVTDGGTLSYQWYSNTSATISGGTKIADANAAAYAISTSTVGTFYYYVVVTNTIANNGDGGIKTATVTSSVAMITVNPRVNAVTPTITTQPVSTAVVVDTTHSVSVTATVTDGGTLSYQWYSNTSNTAAGGTAISDATAASYVIPSGVAETGYYYVVVTNTIADNGDCGIKTATTTSSVATISINATVAADLAVSTIIRDTNTVKNGTYAEAVASRIDALNEWSHFSIDLWATTREIAGILTFDTMTFQYNSELFAVSQIVFGAGFSGTYNTSVSGQVTFSVSADTPHTGQFLLARVELKPAETPYTWTTSTPIESGLGFTANTTASPSRRGSGDEETTKPEITVQNLIVSPVPYDLSGNGGAVDLQDFSVFIKQFGKVQEKYTGADFNGDGKVDLQDFSQFIKAFGKSRTSGLKNPVAAIGEPPAFGGEHLAAVLSSPMMAGEHLAPSVSAGLADDSLHNVSGDFAAPHPPLFQPLAPISVITADYRLHSGCYWVSESRIQSEEFYRRRFFEELAMETESTEVSDKWLTLEAVL